MAFTGKIIPRESLCRCILCFFFNDTATTEIYTLSLHDALPISPDEMKSRSERCLGLIDGAYPKEMVSDEKDRSASVSEEGRRGVDRPGFSSQPHRVHEESRRGPGGGAGQLPFCLSRRRGAAGRPARRPP